MEEKIKRNIISAAILGLIMPTSSLLYVRKEEMAVVLVSILACSVFMLAYTPIVYFATSLWVVFIIQILIWISSFFLGLWHACKGISFESMLEDKGPWLAAYALLIAFIIAQLGNIPVSVFTTQKAYLGFDARDVIIVQEGSKPSYLNMLDYVVFFDENFDEAIGQIIALPGDVLKQKENGMLRNNEAYNFSINLPEQAWILPDSMMLISLKVPATKTDTFKKQDATNHLAKQDNSANNISKEQNTEEQNKPEIKPDEITDNLKVMILPVERIKGKALYILFSRNILNIGKKLTQNVVS